MITDSAMVGQIIQEVFKFSICPHKHRQECCIGYENIWPIMYCLRDNINMSAWIAHYEEKWLWVSMSILITREWYTRILQCSVHLVAYWQKMGYMIACECLLHEYLMGCYFCIQAYVRHSSIAIIYRCVLKLRKFEPDDKSQLSDTFSTCLRNSYHSVLYYIQLPVHGQSQEPEVKRKHNSLQAEWGQVVGCL